MVGWRFKAARSLSLTHSFGPSLSFFIAMNNVVHLQFSAVIRTSSRLAPIWFLEEGFLWFSFGLILCIVIGYVVVYVISIGFEFHFPIQYGVECFLNNA